LQSHRRSVKGLVAGGVLMGLGISGLARASSAVKESLFYQQGLSGSHFDLTYLHQSKPYRVRTYCDCNQWWYPRTCLMLERR